jgi:hypothetical protein
MAVVRLILVSSLHMALFLTIAHIHIILFTILSYDDDKIPVGLATGDAGREEGWEG